VLGRKWIGVFSCNLIRLRLQKANTTNMSVVLYRDYILPLCLLRAPAAVILLSTKPTFTVTLLRSNMLKINSSLEYFLFLNTCHYAGRQFC